MRKTENGYYVTAAYPKVGDNNHISKPNIATSEYLLLTKVVQMR